MNKLGIKPIDSDELSDLASSQQDNIRLVHLWEVLLEKGEDKYELVDLKEVKEGDIVKNLTAKMNGVVFEILFKY